MRSETSTTAVAAAATSAIQSGPPGASPTRAAAGSTSSGYTIEKGRPSLKTFHARAAQTSRGGGARWYVRPGIPGIVLGCPKSGRAGGRGTNNGH